VKSSTSKTVILVAATKCLLLNEWQLSLFFKYIGWYWGVEVSPNQQFT
jgi:hypothetical protein